MRTRQIVVLAALAVLLVFAAVMGSGSARADTVNFNIPPEFDNYLSREVMRAVSEVQSAHPELGDFEVRVEPLGYKTYAGTTNHGNIVVNSAYLADPGRWSADFALDKSMYFHGRACDNVGEYVGYHEAAHVIAYFHGNDADDIAAWIYGDGRGLPLSGYSFHSDGTAFWDEALADAYAEYMCGAPSPLEADLTHVLENS